MVTTASKQDCLGPTTRPATFSRRIKEQARAEGFDKVGIVRAEELTREGHLLRDWLAHRYHGEMQWMEREPGKRADPRLLFPAARSVVVVALNYYTSSQYQEKPGTGKVSRYAWGDDYHEVVGTKLRHLLDWVKQEAPEAEGKVCVDIQPMMDKAWAVRAGFGWIGKHSNLITQEFGSWIFLGELLLNLELESDVDQIEDHCGNCTLCIEACPTAAITEPYIVDANKCVSYATIELRSDNLPAGVSEHLEGWLYGCDICQDVCPWNRFEQITNEPRFEPRPGNVDAELSEVIALTPETYAERFRHSAIKRAKLSGLKRNASELLRRADQKSQSAGSVD